jgi:protease I
MSLEGKRVAVLVGDEYEELEVWYPLLRLQEEGAQCDLIGLEAEQPAKGKHGYPAKSDKGINDVSAADYDAIVVPGGYMPDKLRRSKAILEFCQEFDKAGKVIGVICHGPWILVSAKLLKGRTMTSTPAVRDDVENAGATWVDREAVRDRNLISARRPSDLPAFCKLMIAAMQEK